MVTAIPIDHLIREFQAAAQEHHRPFDGSAEWRTSVNAATARMVVVAREVAESGPDAVAQFATLVGSPDRRLSLWAAHHLLDFMNPDAEARERALEVVQRTASSDSAEAAAERLWLDSLQDEQQDE